MTAIRVTIPGPIAEGASALLTGTLQDERGKPIGPGDLVSLKLTLYQATSEAIINLRDHIDVLTTMGGSLDAQGHLEVMLTGLDNVITVPVLERERHVALFEWVYDTDRTGKMEVWFDVENLAKVP